MDEKEVAEEVLDYVEGCAELLGHLKALAESMRNLVYGEDRFTRAGGFGVIVGIASAGEVDYFALDGTKDGIKLLGDFVVENVPKVLEQSAELNAGEKKVFEDEKRKVVMSKQ